ncbi:MAG: phytoene desaturase family protein [Acidobacteriota bacterium]|nr:phytoene desaturase family protein [Acidobacteriota bacterium]
MKTVGIVGAGLGGLSAAIHLRNAGHPVTIFEANPRVGGRANLIEREGFRFDTGPSLLNYPWVFEDLFRSAGRELRDYVTLLPVDPSVQFRWLSGTRFQLSSDLKSLLAECERLEPGSRPSVLAFLRDAAAKYRLAFNKLVSRNQDNAFKWLGGLSFREMRSTSLWRSLDSEIGRFFRSRYIREALGSYGMYLGGSPHELPGLFSILAYGELAYGLWLPKGGVYGLVAGMEKLARELGVSIEPNCRVRKIVSEGERATGIELDSGATARFDIVVSNVDVPTTESSLLDGCTASKPRMTSGVLTFYWGIRGKLSNIGHHTIFLPADARLAFDELCRKKQVPAELPFYVSLPSETDADLAPPGDTSMFVLVPVPVISHLPDVDVPGIKARILERLDHDGISLDPSRIVCEEVWTPREWRKRFGLFDGSAFGAAHTLFQMGPFRARNHSAKLKGLYYVGAGTTPGTGMPMVVLGGQMTAERIQSHVH